MSDLVWEMVRDYKTGRCRVDLIEIETDLLLFHGPWRKYRGVAVMAAMRQLKEMLQAAGVWESPPQVTRS